MTTSIRSGATSSSLQVNGVDSLNFNAGGAERKIESVTCTQSGGALTFTLNPTVLSFRSTTLTTGVPVTANIDSAITLTLPSGGSLGFVTTVQGRAILVAINNAGTPELAVINLASGVDLSETGVINTTAISAAATSASTIYSTTARTGVAYRVVGSVDATNTAGAWGNPTLVQGYGGQALAAMSSLGYGQTWQSFSTPAQRTSAVTYYNTTGKPIQLGIMGNSVTTTLSVNGVVVSQGNGANHAYLIGVVPAGGSYIVSAGTFISWAELR